MITTDSIVKGSFPTSAGHRVEFEGKVIRIYTIQDVVPMIEVDTPDGPMHAQIADAEVIGTWKAPKKEKIMGNRTKVRGNGIKEGMTILVSEIDREEDEVTSRWYPDHRVTKATQAKVTGEPTIRMTGGFHRSTRHYVIPTSVGEVIVPSTQTITVISLD